MFIRNMKVIGKISLLAGVLITFLLGIGWYSLQQMAELDQVLDTVFADQLLPITHMAAFRHTVMENALLVNEHVNSTDQVAMQEVEVKITENERQADEALSAYLATNLSGQEQQLITAFEQQTADYRVLRDEVLALSRAGQQDRAQDAQAVAASKRNERMQTIAKLVEVLQQDAEANRLQCEANYTNTLRTFYIVLGVAILLGGAAAFLIARTISKPLQTLEQAAAQVADGDLSATWDVSGQDEIGSLSQSFARMVSELRKVIEEVQHDAISVSASAQELSAGTEHSTQAVTHMATLAQDLADQSHAQDIDVQTAMAALEQSSAAVEQIAATVQQVAAAANETTQQAQLGEQAMAEATEAMEQIHHAFDNVSLLVRSLGEQSQAIGQIIDLISTIAQQTNLLALNAAIEAARAGEHGRGFTVVAEEVRKLAEQSSQATVEIIALIQAVQEQAARAVQGTELGNNTVANGRQVIEQGNRNFELIEVAIATVAQQINEVANATQELATGSEGITHSVESISIASQQVAATAEGVAADAEEQTASIEEIAASAEALAELSERLQQAVAHFRLK